MSLRTEQACGGPGNRSDYSKDTLYRSLGWDDHRKFLQYGHYIS